MSAAAASRESAPPGGRAVVFGLGRFGGGAGAARRLAREGWDVLVTDLRGADVLAPTLAELADVDGLLRYALGRHDPADFERADLVVANPAVRPDHELLARARRCGAAITTEVELFLSRATNPVAAVTGTQGKSSTVRMAADFLAAAGIPARAGGNLGGSLLDALDELDPREVCVLELSSYQLEHLGEPARRMRAVAVTNVLRDHLERHGTVAAYAAAKARILELVAPDGIALLPGGDAATAAWRPPPPATRVDVWPRAARTRPEDAAAHDLFAAEGLFRHGDACLGRTADLGLPGAYQVGNALFALGIARACGARPERLAGAIGAARGLEHRLEDLGAFAGRRVIDNGVSTTPDSTAAALAEVEPGAVLLVGGQAKRDLAWDGVIAVARARATRVIAFGASAPEIARAFAAGAAGGLAIETAAGVPEAVALAFAAPRDGAGVAAGPLLFSPACASFDAYANFRARALAFRAALPEARG
jgi:UDP-N-acetylmuramoylalanine--D-glutamate ligase